jgi:NADH dehydrogenase
VAQPRILIVGGGWGGVFTALGLTGAGEVTLISPEDHFLFTPMLYEYMSGEVEAWHIAPSYKELFNGNIRFIQGEVTDVDFANKEITIAGRTRRAAYDALILAPGGVTNYAGVEGAEEHSLPFRKIRHADALRRRMVDALDRVPPDAAPQDAREAVTFAVVGAGASGVETATKMADLLNDAFRRRGLQGEPRVMIIEMGAQVVPGMDDDLREHVLGALRNSRVEVHLNTRVRRITSTDIIFEHNGEETQLTVAGVVWTGGVSVSPLIERLDVEKDQRGHLLTLPTLQLPAHEEVFALGDIAFFPAKVEELDGTGYTPEALRLGGTAQLAYQQASLVADNIRAFLKGRPLQTKRFAELGEAMSLGTSNATVFAAGQILEGAVARQARFAMYTSRLPTWHHRLRVGASWFFEGTNPRPLGLPMK